MPPRNRSTSARAAAESADPSPILISISLDSEESRWTVRPTALTPAIRRPAAVAEANPAIPRADFSLPIERLLTARDDPEVRSRPERRPHHGIGKRRRHSASHASARARGSAQLLSLSPARRAARPAAGPDRNLAQPGLGRQPGRPALRDLGVRWASLAGQRAGRA